MVELNLRCRQKEIVELNSNCMHTNNDNVKKILAHLSLNCMVCCPRLAHQLLAHLLPAHHLLAHHLLAHLLDHFISIRDECFWHPFKADSLSDMSSSISITVFSKVKLFRMSSRIILGWGSPNRLSRIDVWGVTRKNQVKYLLPFGPRVDHE